MRVQEKNLFTAIMADDVGAVRQALARGAVVNISDVNDRPPLWYAVGQSAEMMDVLLAHGANPNFADERGYTPLMHAVAELDFAAAAAMLQVGGDVTFQAAPRGLSALHSAVFADVRDGKTQRIDFVLKYATHTQIIMNWQGAGFTAEGLARHLTAPDKPAAHRMLAVFAAQREKVERAAAAQMVANMSARQEAQTALQEKLLQSARGPNRKLRL